MTGRGHGFSPPREGGGEELSSLESSPDTQHQGRPGIYRSLSAGDATSLHTRREKHHHKPIAIRNIFTGAYREIKPTSGTWHVVSRSEEEEETYYKSPPPAQKTPTPAPRSPKPAPRKKRVLSEDSQVTEQEHVRRDLRPSPTLSTDTTPSPPQRTSSPREESIMVSPKPLPQRPRDPRIREGMATTAAPTTYAAAVATTTSTTTMTATAQKEIETQPATQLSKERTYPPIVVEALPDWTEHFAALNRLLGHPPNGRPFGKGVRFIPRSPEEYRAIQKYLIEISNKENPISWHSYTPQAEQPIKIAIRGLPGDTPLKEIMEEMARLGFPLQHLKRIPPRRGRPGCLFHAQVERQPNEDMSRLYGITQMLYMSGITIEAWRGKKGPAQCHRCQAFGHSSLNCHRPPKCVRCGENHIAAECERPRTEAASCANCKGSHTANDKRCPFFKREARKMGIKTQPPVPPKPTKKQEARARQRGEEVMTPGDVTPTKPTARAVAGAISTLMPPANPAPNVGPRKSRSRRRRQRKKATKAPEKEAAVGTAQVRVEHHEAEPTAKAVAAPQTQPTESRGADNKNTKTNANAATQRQPPAQPAAVPWNIVHGMLMDILSALTTGADLLPVVLRGLATLTSVQHAESP